MINNEIILRIGASNKKVLLSDGFYNLYTKTSALHNHYHTEIQIITQGDAKFIVDGKQVELSAGDILAIPPNIYHYCTDVSDKNHHIAFYIDKSIPDVMQQTCSLELLQSFLCDIEALKTTNNYSKISAYISLICNDFFKDEVLEPKEVNDYSFIIDSFFAMNYASNPSLKTLASLLHLSEKQAARLVFKYKGKTFKQEIADRRIKIANILINQGKMSLSEIAHHVGYDSYSGFWKALNSTKEKKQ